MAVADAPQTIPPESPADGRPSDTVAPSPGVTIDTGEAPQRDAGTDVVAALVPDVAPDIAPPSEPLISRNIKPSTEIFASPERGPIENFFRLGTDGSVLRAEGTSVTSIVDFIDNYRDRDLDDLYFSRFENICTRLRQTGTKALIRFVYANTMLGSMDAPLDRILRHIAQLKPLLQKNSDVLAAVHAGFVGLWGTWTSSSNNLLTTESRARIIDALLDAVPPTRMLMLPFAADRYVRFPDPVTTETAFSQMNDTRIGFYNFCAFSEQTEGDFYPGGPRDPLRQKVEADTRFVPMGAMIRVCGILVPTPPTCVEAMDAFRRQHVSYLDISDLPSSTDNGWKAGGCWPEIRRRLGYRFQVNNFESPGRVAPGGLLALKINLENTGWGNLHNPRPVYLVLDDGKIFSRAKLSVDPRSWAAGSTTTLRLQVRIPAGWSAGKRRMSLWLPDAADALAANPSFSVRFANEGAWEPLKGLNVLATDLQIDATALGPRDPNAAELIEVR